jgi:protein gp37
MSDTYWKQPLKWNAEAAATGERRRVFYSSMADVFDEERPIDQHERLRQLIRQTLSLDWLLLTKRPQNISKLLPADWNQGYSNVWLGAGVEDKEYGLPRVDLLREIPAEIRFLSVEPLLEDLGEINLSWIHWVIVGGESGSGAPSMDATWVESVIAQCSLENVPVWVKQLGKKAGRKASISLSGVRSDEALSRTAGNRIHRGCENL